MTAAKADPFGGSDGRFAVVIQEDDGEPMHTDDCEVCTLFGPRRRPTETRGAWLGRLADAVAEARARCWPELDEGWGY